MIFLTRYKHSKYQVIIFKIADGIASFEDYIYKIFTEKLDIYIIIYRKTILINKNKKNNINFVEYIFDNEK